MTNTTLSLLAAHDAELITLPQELVRLREAHDRATEHSANLPTPPHFLDAREEVTNATVEAFISGAVLPTVDAVLDAERESRAFEHRLEIARNAVAALDRRFAGAVAESADQIITDVLRPVFDATITKMQEAYALLGRSRVRAAGRWPWPTPRSGTPQPPWTPRGTPTRC